MHFGSIRSQRNAYVCPFVHFKLKSSQSFWWLKSSSWLSRMLLPFSSITAYNFVLFYLGVFQLFFGNIVSWEKSIDVGWGNLNQNWIEMKTLFKTPVKEKELVSFSFMESLIDRKQYQHNLNFTVLPVAYPLGKCFR